VIEINGKTSNTSIVSDAKVGDSIEKIEQRSDVVEDRQACNLYLNRSFDKCLRHFFYALPRLGLPRWYKDVHNSSPRTEAELAREEVRKRKLRQA